MRRKFAFVLWLVSALIIGSFVADEAVSARLPIEYTAKIMGIPIVENSDFLEEKQKGILKERPEIYFDDILLPYSESNQTLYVSQSVEQEKWLGKLSVKKNNTFICAPWDDYWQQKEAAIREGHSFTLWLVTEEEYYELSLVVSGMPIISIDTESSQEQNYDDADSDTEYFGPEVLCYGKLRLFNPGVGTVAYEAIECNVEYHEKGSSTSNFDKLPYAIDLKDSKWEKLNLSLLGMRQDDSWKLNAMVMDESRIREKTAAQIWENFDRASAVNEAGAKMEYVELILDNDYQGLYCLVEPVDAKKLALDQNDVLYKIVTWAIPEDSYMQAAMDNGSHFKQSIRLRYPKPAKDYYQAWYPMRDYLNLFYRGEGVRTDTVNRLNWENALDILFFNMVVSGSDNYFKNMYLVADVDAQGNYQMLHIPWDLDLTFGIVYADDGVNNVKFDKDYTYNYAMEWFPVLMEHHRDCITETMPDKWRQYRKDFLKTEVIQQIFRENYTYLMSTGVVERENARWENYQINTNLDELLDFQANRMEWLDTYFTEKYEEKWTLETIPNTAMR